MNRCGGGDQPAQARLGFDARQFLRADAAGGAEDYPASYITSFHLPDTRREVVNALVREFPNLTVVDVAAIVRQLQSVLDQVAQAVQFIFLFTLAAGIAVLHAALGTAFAERRFELAVMRSLGRAAISCDGPCWRNSRWSEPWRAALRHWGGGGRQGAGRKAFQFEVATSVCRFRRPCRWCVTGDGCRLVVGATPAGDFAAAGAQKRRLSGAICAQGIQNAAEYDVWDLKQYSPDDGKRIALSAIVARA